MFQNNSAFAIPNFPVSSSYNLRNIDIAIPIANKKIPEIPPADDHAKTINQTSFQFKRKKSEILQNNEQELKTLLAIEKSVSVKNLKGLFEGNTNIITPVLVKPHAKIPKFNYDSSANYKDLCNFTRISIHKQLNYLKQLCIEMNF